MRIQFEPLVAWSDPITDPRRSSGAFRASWSSTVRLLEREAAFLGADLVVLQVDAAAQDVRKDGMLKTRAKVGFPGVVVSFNSDHGPLRYASDAYEQEWGGAPPGWQTNTRAIALALQALRAVDRYGVTHRAEQYVGFRALPAAPNVGFASADAALRWMREQGRPFFADPAIALPDELYRGLAKQFHPDVGGTAAEWERLDQARRLLEEANLL
ncbi:hypothetical protein [Actinomadura madurae]|uniref:hypothetical protein n=1 Tax=Actinomadura madurae TaxID=1993 RepID=UPI0020D1FC18|nr:hypothetical protein [Actinomadura madurae]MCP9947199.1 hypothetical protein [Actinomadura madurae]MCP9963965.1 hypothetical protein [Actinomadura madurae]MCP9976439.1 hypothetical protein [Actinomadura madurae]MCQ0012068.1 hypothetical protein [Actinomadura madurae]MCQ0012632.1 hypothetical protein [Actinomadura madurae]